MKLARTTNPRPPAALALGVTLLALTLAAGPAWAGGNAKAYSGRFGKVTAKHYAVQPDSAEFYAQEWELRAWNEAGDSVNVNFVVNNLGFGDNKLVVSAKARPAGGKSVKGSKKYSSGDWKSAKKPFRISAGANSLSGGPGKLRAKVSVGKVKLDLTLTNVLPPWRPAGGRIKYGSSDEFYDFTYLAPRAKVSGTVTAGGKTFTLKDADGFADHRIVNVPPQTAGRRWLTWRSFDGDWTVLAQQVTFPKDLGGRKAQFLLVGYKDRIVFQTVRFKVKYGSLKPDPKGKAGYKYPEALKLEAKAGDRSVVLTAKGTLRTRRDLLASAGAAKAIIGQFVAPIGYYMDGAYDLQVSLGDGQSFSHQGKGDYTFKQVNP